MGYTTNGSIRSFWPDDNESTLYLDSQSLTLDELLQRARQKWGDDVQLSQLKVEAEHIHTNCLGYDRYDPGDYTNFLVIRRELNASA